MTFQSDQADFQCPGESSKISRAVHLARLADGYPGCRQCRHRHEIEGLSQRTRRRLPEAGGPKSPADFLHEEGVLGSFHEGLDPMLAGRFAAAFGITLREEAESAGRYPSVAVAGDGRAVTQRHFVRVVEKLRWVGCDVVDLGSLPGPALPWVMGELESDGGLYLGNPKGDPYQAAFCFYGRGGQPLTGIAALRPIFRRAETEPIRPVRASGKAGKANALSLYESSFANSFHALRPLRFSLHTTCRPVGACVTRLLQETGCNMVLHESETALPCDPKWETIGHFAVAIDDDGRRCRLWDERRRAVPFERLFLLLIQSVYRDESAARTVVVDGQALKSIHSRLREQGCVVRCCGSFPSQVHAEMVDSGARLGADGTGRIWYGETGRGAIADALGTLTRLLQKLSESDRPLSDLLDAGAAAH